jgi:hypothetical protein
VLVTTNDPIRKLHPAVARPGRCAANVEFVALSPDEATRWLRSRGVEEAAEEPRDLASLYLQTGGGEAFEVSAEDFGSRSNLTVT